MVRFVAQVMPGRETLAADVQERALRDGAARAVELEADVLSCWVLCGAPIDPVADSFVLPPFSFSFPLSLLLGVPPSWNKGPPP